MIIRWICEKCGKKWIYPVEKCVYCKGPITKQKGSKIKVIGITKVAIPSPMHPIVPYNILLLQDEHGNRLPRKTMKEYKIGDAYIEQKAKGKDAVSIVKVKYDVYEAIKDAVELINGSGITKGDKVLIKPSIVMAAYPYQAVNTNPVFLEALIAVLLEDGVGKDDIIVAEQALMGSDVFDAASKAGILEVCKKHGIRFIDISKGPFEEVESEGYKFRLFKDALSMKVINVPIMKTNFQIGISGAMENLSRLADEETQRRMYYDDIDVTLPKLVKAVSNLINIADATNGMQGQGPLALGEPAFLNLVYASRNPASLDAAFCHAAMLDVPAHVLGYGTDVKNIEAVGNEIESLKYPIKPALPHETPHPDIKVIDGKACPACLNLMYGLTSRLIGTRGRELTIITGPIIDKNLLESKERIFVLGNCAINKLNEIGVEWPAKIEEKGNHVEQILLMKKLLETEGAPKITHIDKVKSKMKSLLSKVVR